MVFKVPGWLCNFSQVGLTWSINWLVLLYLTYHFQLKLDKILISISFLKYFTVRFSGLQPFSKAQCVFLHFADF